MHTHYTPDFLSTRFNVIMARPYALPIFLNMQDPRMRARVTRDSLNMPVDANLEPLLPKLPKLPKSQRSGYPSDISMAPSSSLTPPIILWFPITVLLPMPGYLNI